jgi:hypothetical protein
MAARIKVDDFIGLASRVYEKHLDSDEVVSLIAILEAKKAGKPASVSPELQKKFTAETPAMLGEITGASTELAARLSMQVGSEIGQEHPEYLARESAARQPANRQPANRQLP